MGVDFGQRTDLWSDFPVEESFDLLRHTYHIQVSRYHEHLDLFNQILGLDELFRTPGRQYHKSRPADVSRHSSSITPRP